MASHRHFFTRLPVITGFIRLGNRARPFKEGMARPGMGSLRNVSISDVQAAGADRTGCAIAGLPGHPIENVTLSNIRLGFVGGGKPEEARRRAPERAESYPSHSMFGTLPAYGFYCRHVQNLVFHNVAVSSAEPDLSSVALGLGGSMGRFDHAVESRLGMAVAVEEQWVVDPPRHWKII
jgi:hypothetical protein